MQETVWELVQMLATNEKVHQSLMPSDNGNDFWTNTFEDPNPYRKIYKQDIIYDLMETGDIDEIRRIQWIDGFEKYKNIQPKDLKCIKTEDEDKQKWKQKFLADD